MTIDSEISDAGMTDLNGAPVFIILQGSIFIEKTLENILARSMVPVGWRRYCRLRSGQKEKRICEGDGLIGQSASQWPCVCAPR